MYKTITLISLSPTTVCVVALSIVEIVTLSLVDVACMSPFCGPQMLRTISNLFYHIFLKSVSGNFHFIV
jgi:hypothetical protein